MLQKITGFFRREAVLTISLLLALLSLLITPPDALYAGYIDWSVLMMLFCLMAVVAGLQRCGGFQALCGPLARLGKSTRHLALALSMACFFGAMLVTNDVALITFVPLTLLLLGGRDERIVLRTVAIETVAANLGSMATPIGNPQNLFLYTRYALSMGDFLRAVLPLGALSLLLCAALCLLVPAAPVQSAKQSAKNPLDRRALVLHLALLAVCLLAVFKVLSVPVCFLIVLLAALALDRRALLGVDYALLATFICFFVFVGNIGRIEAVSRLLQSAMAGRETFLSALCSQVISNVPTAILLAPFTQEAAALLRGVNIGGLGTPIASLASLISLKFYLRRPGGHTGRYLVFFSVVNFALLVLLLAADALLPC